MSGCIKKAMVGVMIRRDNLGPGHLFKIIGSVLCVRADVIVIKSNHFFHPFDIAVFKLRAHPAFPSGFPTLDVADYADLHEMMPVATCGYPFGDFLWNQTGSVTSSFTTGMMSSILPAPGIAREHLSGFQLDL